MTLYLDTSAWVKLYVAEPGSVAVRTAVEEAELVGSHLVAYVELRAALGRKRRLREVSMAAMEAAEADWQRLHRLPLDYALVQRAGALTDHHALRGFDAIHLAAAESLQQALRVLIRFACFDMQLTAAARALGMKVLTT